MHLHNTALALALVVTACGEKELDASSEQGQAGASCEPGDEAACGDGLACEPADPEGSQHICAAAVELRGQVFDALTEEPIEGALVVANDELGAPVTRVVPTDADGRYALEVSVVRDADGEIAQTQRWTLIVSARDYLAFPGSLRPALPINAQDVVDEPGATEDAPIVHVVDNASTSVALIPLPDDAATGVTIHGQVEGERAAGTLVVAEALTPARLGIADLDGSFTLFNVPEGSTEIRGYRQGVELQPATVDVGSEDVEDVRLTVVTEAESELGTVRGSVNIVNAPGGLATSVVLVPHSVFHEVFERGPVPLGLRAPSPPQAPSVNAGFEITGVPSGDYWVLAAFENDALVRDPDTSIAGTQLAEVTVAQGEVVETSESFKVTEAIAVIAPGADAPAEVSASPTFTWEDDSSEDRYEIVVFDALGEQVWRDDQIPRVTGGSVVEQAYEGDPLEIGMYYQFRVTSWRDAQQGATAISRSEDLRGVFVVR